MENTCNRHAREYSRLIHNELITVKYNTILHNNYNTNYSPYSYHTSIKQNTKSCTYVGLYGSGLCSLLASQPCLHAFWVLTSLHLHSLLLKMFFIILYCFFF